jgi:flagellar biosynthesis protein FlhF
MRLKSYFVHTMEEALQAAKVELGEDAMLVDSKQLEAPAGGRSRLEVIFAAAAAPPPPPKVTARPLPVRKDSIAGLQQFRGELTTLLDALNRRPDATRLESVSPARPQLDGLRASLLLAEVPPLAADSFVGKCRPLVEGLILRGDRVESAQVEEAVLPLMAAEWPHLLDAEAAKPKVLVFVGPTGAGKTSAIAKLAFRLGVAKGHPVYVFSIDSLRIGASDQLAHLCSLLGVPFQALDYSGALYTAVSAVAGRGLVLIDTPGYGFGDGDLMDETAGQLRRLDGVACHLVVPATLRYSEMQRRQQHFAPFSPSRLLYTRLDETEYFGPAWAFAREVRLPVDWVSTGPGVPEDIEDADAFRLSSALLGKSTYTSGTSAQPASNLANAASAGAARI